MIRVQAETFDPAEAFKLQDGRADVGALAVFVGYVRDVTAGLGVETLELQHYPGFTESVIEGIVAETQKRFSVLDLLVVHRHGKLSPTEPIVLVAVLSEHRDAAFEAARYLMDALKTDAPFWKLEQGETGTRWIEPRADDYAARTRWTKTGEQGV
jgi:molybdopterin synthase catalytic subunit